MPALLEVGAVNGDEAVRVELIDRQGRVRDRWRVEPAQVERWTAAQQAAHRSDGWRIRVVPLEQPVPFAASGGSDA